MTKDRKNGDLALRAALPQASPFHIEIDKCKGGVSLLASGVIKINAFSDENVHLSARGLDILAFGEGLCMTVYENKTVEIVGRIRKVEYEYSKN